MDLWAAIRPGFAIVDGIVGMEGDGPIMGTAVPHGILLFGEHLPAVDAVAARLMGFEPDRVRSFALALPYGGTVSERRISRIGDALPTRRYDALEKWSHLRSG